MGISIYKIKKWYNMVRGKSIHHVKQGIGNYYSKEEIAGYYNDLTQKVIKDDPNILIPRYSVDTGQVIYFSIGIFQYGLAAYDLFLATNNEVYKNKVIACANWAVKNQQKDGSWVTFDYKDSKNPYSSMAQGEGISLLIRASLVYKDPKYIESIKKALSFMLIPLEKGGTTKYENNDVYFYECTGNPLVLNGWIFSIWGLIDYYKFFQDEKVKNILDSTLRTLECRLSNFDIGYWSMYEDGTRISSLFYHDLHIAQLEVMYDLTGKEVYKYYANKFKQYKNNGFNRKKAFIRKVIQKIFKE